jgi:hypothetical protein
LSTGTNFTVTLGGNRTLSFPSNLRVGKRGYLRVLATGATRTLTLGASFRGALLAPGGFHVEASGAGIGILTTQTLIIEYVVRSAAAAAGSVMVFGFMPHDAE